MNVLYNGTLGSLLTLKLSTMQSKGIVLFPCELQDSLQCHIVNLYNSQPLEQLRLLQYSKLRMAKTVVKISVVQVYNTYSPCDSQLCKVHARSTNERAIQW